MEREGRDGLSPKQGEGNGEEGLRERSGKKPGQKGFVPVLLIMVGVLFFLVMLVLPLVEVIYRSLKDGLASYVNAVTAENTIAALKVTLIAAVIALAVNTFFGLCASWLLTKFEFPGKHVLSVLIDIPFSISPVIAGLAYIMTFGRMGWATPMVEQINQWLGTDISLVFSIPGVVLATIFVTFPFVSRELIPVMQAQGNKEEEAAVMLGARGFTIFRKVTFPHIKWALLYGVILCAARAFGEFGAVYAVSKARGKTFTLPLEIDALYMAGSADSITQAFAVSSLLVALAVLILILKQVVEYFGKDGR